MNNPEILMLPARVGMQSCVGINTDRPFPLPFGNYFALSDGTRILNFWSENLQMACRRFLDDGKVKVYVWSWDSDHGKLRAGLIWDDRIPFDWYHNKMCFTGFGRPPVEVATEMYALVGDPGNEMEYWRDVEMYHARKNQRYHANGVVSWNCGESAEKMVAELLERRSKETHQY
jgi:hypothetical protein